MKNKMYKRIAISEIGSIVAGATPKTSDATNYGGDIPWLTPADLSGYTNKYIERGARNISKKGYDSCSTQIMPAGSILFSSRAPIGYVAIAANPICTNQGFKSIVPNKNVDSEFLFYQLKFLKNQIADLGRGTTFKEISGKTLGSVEIVLPDLKEQKRIVNKIEELFSELDSAVETLKKTKEQLAVYRQSVLKAAFEKAGNQYVELKNLIEKPKYGTSKKCECKFTKKSIAVFRIPNIDFKSGVIDQSELKYAVFLDAELTNIDLKENDLLIIRSNGSVSLVGRSAVVRREDVNATYAGYLMRLRLLNPSEPMAKYLHYFLESHDARIYIENVAKSTSGVNNINSQEIANLKINICDDKRVKSIVTEIEESLSLCRGIEKTVNDALAQAEAMRQSILKKAFEGGL